ncbi:MAG: AraC family transcriptional regulator [Alistipes sp.]
MNTENHDSPITDYSLNELVALSGGETHRGLMGECIAANSESRLQSLRFPYRIDAFIIGVGTEGETTGSINMQEYRLKKDSMFIFTPNNILQIATDTRFRAHVIAVSTEFMRNINIDIKHMMPLFLQLGAHPCFEISPAESQSLRSFIAMVEQEVQGPETQYASDIISGLLAATVYKVGDILQHYTTAHSDNDKLSQDRTGVYFKQFMQLLGEHYRQERSVNFYARQLCITPKYLTTLIKRISAKSASEWIDSYVTLEAKTLLKHSQMSVQEISYYLNFPNQSFFGSYFRRNTGMSPSQYKAQN